MKHISKRREPQKFTDWKKLANNDWQPTYDSLSGDEKKEVLDSLKAGQGHICCYCEQNLNTSDCHIEHIKPQERYVEDALDFDNMLCSCQKNIKKGTPRHCGNSKENWYQEELFISPLDPGCENKFKYTFDGQIFPAQEADSAAKTTIEKLQLSIDKLNALRKNVIEPFIDVDEELSPDERTLFVQGYLVNKEDNNGRFNEFYTTIKYLFNN